MIAEAEQHAEPIGPADHKIFPEQIIAEQQEELFDLGWKGESAPDQHPDAERDHAVAATCIHKGSVVKRVITHRSRCHRPG